MHVHMYIYIYICVPLSQGRACSEDARAHSATFQRPNSDENKRDAGMLTSSRAVLLFSGVVVLRVYIYIYIYTYVFVCCCVFR